MSVASTTGNLTGKGKVSDILQVGAHQTHLLYLNGLRSTATDTLDDRCGYCHTVPALSTHANGTAMPVFSGLSTSTGMVTKYVSGTCNNTYCHNPAGANGSLLLANAGTGTAPLWTDASYLGDTLKTQANCGKCHKSPGDTGFEPAATHNLMTVTATICITCHGHEGDTQGVAGQRHMDGIKYGGGNCDSCHAYDTGGTYTGGIWSGGTWTHTIARDGIGQGWGAHVKHINHIKTRLGIPGALNPVSQVYGSGEPATVCGVCHDNSATHDMGGNITGREVHFSSSTTYQFGAIAPLYNGASGESSLTNPKTCSNVSCHFKETPVWSAY